MDSIISALVALDAQLDTMVFGRPLGFFGERINENSNFTEEMVDDQTDIIW